MKAEKFGLDELERYEAEVGFKGRDVRTIRGVCAIVDLPLTVVPEAQEIIANYNKDVINAEKRIAEIKTADARNDVEVKDDITRLKEKRESTKQGNKRLIAVSRVETKNSNGEIDRLAKLLKNFS